MPPHTRQDASQRNPEKTQVPARTWRRQPQSPLVQHKTTQLPRRTVRWFLKTLKIELPRDPASPLLRAHPKI